MSKAIKTGDSVFQFIEGVTVETFERDEEFRGGTITDIVAKKVRIRWIYADGTETYEYLVRDMLDKVDIGTVVVETPWNGEKSGHIAWKRP